MSLWPKQIKSYWRNALYLGWSLSKDGVRGEDHLNSRKSTCNLQSAFHILQFLHICCSVLQSQPTVDWLVLWYLILKKKNPCVSEPVQFKHMFKGQPHILDSLLFFLQEVICLQFLLVITLYHEWHYIEVRWGVNKAVQRGRKTVSFWWYKPKQNCNQSLPYLWNSNYSEILNFLNI